MNEYKYNDIYIGQEESFLIKISEEMMNKFFSITNDKNPLHHNQKFAHSKGFNNKVVFGMLTASFISTLGGVYLPGKYCLIHSVETKFLKPVYIGDSLTITGKIKEKHDSVQQIDIKIVMINQMGEKVLRGLLKVGFLNE